MPQPDLLPCAEFAQPLIAVHRTTNHTLKSWITRRRTALCNELAKVAAPFEISNNNGNNFSVTNQTTLTLTGKSPVEVTKHPPEQRLDERERDLEQRD